MSAIIPISEYENRKRAEPVENSLQGAQDGWPEPMPLVRPLPDPAPYPIDALGPILGNAALGIAEVVQCPVGIAGSSVLAVASLATQAHWNVQHPATGRASPLSLFLMTIAESGERKSAADHEALTPIRRREAELSETYRDDYKRWKNDHDAWEACRSAVKRKAKSDTRQLRDMLADLGEEPKAPRKPHLTVSEPTFEGLAKLFESGQPSIGLFSAEGGGFLGGHALKDDNRLRALTGLSELWDGSVIKRTRAGDGATQLAGKRLSMHLMVQPNIAPMLLGDDMAVGQGFLSRLLVTAPATMQGHRLQRDPQPWARPAIAAYAEVIYDLLRKPPRTIGDNELDLSLLSLSQEAVNAWRIFAQDMERSLAVEGQAVGTRGLRNKLPELALRIAGVLCGIDTQGAKEISATAFASGVEIAGYHLSEAQRLYEASAISPEISRADRLLKWLRVKASPVTVRHIQNAGPSALREASVLEATLHTLEAHGLCRVETQQTGGRPMKVVMLSPYLDV